MTNDRDKLISFSELQYYIKRRFKVLILIIIIINIFSITINMVFKKEPMYKGTATIFVGKNEAESSIYQTNEINLYERLAKTYVYMFTSKDIVEKALKKINIDEPIEEFKENTIVKVKTDTQILEISYVSADKEEIIPYINSLYEVFSEEISNIIQNSNVYMIETPTYLDIPINSTDRIPIAISLLISIFIGLIWIIVLEKRNNFINSAEEIERLINKYVIAEIPKIQSFEVRDRLLSSEEFK